MVISFQLAGHSDSFLQGATPGTVLKHAGSQEELCYRWGISGAGTISTMGDWWGWNQINSGGISGVDTDTPFGGWWGWVQIIPGGLLGLVQIYSWGDWWGLDQLNSGGISRAWV